MAGVVLTLLCLRVIAPLVRGLGPATVTVINATGGTMADVHVALNGAGASIRQLKDGQQATVAVPGNFGEASTVIRWRDQAGTNSASAGDYMEGGGFYHSTVVITPDRKAKAIYQ